MDRSSKQNIIKETQVLNDTLDKMNLIDIFRTYHQNVEKYTFFSSAHGTLSRIDHIWGHKPNLSKLTKNLNHIKHLLRPQRYETRYQLKEKKVRNGSKWRLNNMFLNNQKVTEEIKREVKIFLETNDSENKTTQNLWIAAKAVLRRKFIAM